MCHTTAKHIMAVKVKLMRLELIFIPLSFSFSVQKIPMKDLRTSGGNVLELDVIKKAKECPFIVHFYGCLLREVSHTHYLPPYKTHCQWYRVMYGYAWSYWIQAWPRSLRLRIIK